MSSNRNSISNTQDEYLDKFRQQVQAQFMQEVISKMNERCYKICVTKKGDKLDSSEKQCLANCVDRYGDSLQVVGKALSDRQNR